MTQLAKISRLPAHAPVVRPRNPAGESGIGAFRTALTNLHSHVAVRLAAHANRNFLIAFCAVNDSTHAVFGNNLDTLIPGCAESCAPSPVECARRWRIHRAGSRAHPDNSITANLKKIAA